MLTGILEKLSRVTSSQKFIPEIDGLRFIAIASVAFYHLRTTVLKFGIFDEGGLKDDLFFAILSRGGLGVNLFFTISGFILALPFLKQFVYGSQVVNIRKYFIRRLTRLEPPYIIIMTVLFIGQLMMLSLKLNELFPHYVASLLYLHFFIYGAWSTINPVAWSLETEVQFYILAPLIAFVFKIRSIRLRFVIYLCVVCLHLYFVSHYTAKLVEWHLIKSIAYYFTNFFIGFILADIFLVKGFIRVTKSIVFDLIGAVSLYFLFYAYYESGWVFSVLFFVSTGGVFVAAFKGIIFNHVLTNRVITTIGGMCYTIYLLHYVFFFFAGSIFGAFLAKSTSDFYGAFFFSALLLVPLLLVLSAVCFYFIEKPFMKLGWYSSILRGKN